MSVYMPACQHVCVVISWSCEHNHNVRSSRHQTPVRCTPLQRHHYCLFSWQTPAAARVRVFAWSNRSSELTTINLKPACIHGVDVVWFALGLLEFKNRLISLTPPLRCFGCTYERNIFGQVTHDCCARRLHARYHASIIPADRASIAHPSSSPAGRAMVACVTQHN